MKEHNFKQIPTSVLEISNANSKIKKMLVMILGLERLPKDHKLRNSKEKKCETLLHSRTYTMIEGATPHFLT